MLRDVPRRPPVAQTPIRLQLTPNRQIRNTLEILGNHTKKYHYQIFGFGQSWFCCNFQYRDGGDPKGVWRRRHGFLEATSKVLRTLEKNKNANVLRSRFTIGFRIEAPHLEQPLKCPPRELVTIRWIVLVIGEHSQTCARTSTSQYSIFLELSETTGHVQDASNVRKAETCFTVYWELAYLDDFQEIKISIRTFFILLSWQSDSKQAHRSMR